MTKRGTHVIQVYKIYEYPKTRAGSSDAWEVWGALDVAKTSTFSRLSPHTYWTTDPTVADTAEVSMRNNVPLIVDWVDSGMGQHVSGCELWAERKTA